ncbi:MAG: MBL fold metallo-hydrolase, partial [Clostridia bacterium]|nr:MBL fold metallo-hydrolase [Clostridia bacterium]
MKQKKKFEFTKRRILIFLAILIISVIFYIVIISFSNEKLKTNNDLVCYFLDVNQGDCVVIKLPDNKVMIIDSGNIDNESHFKFTTSINEIFKGRQKIVDYLILTHSDSDHCGGMEYLFENFKIKNFYRPKQFILDYENVNQIIYNSNNFISASSNETYFKTIKCSQNEEDVNVFYNQAGIKIYGYQYRFDFLAPTKQSYQSPNQFSAVIQLTYKNKTFLFTGDITKD